MRIFTLRLVCYVVALALVPLTVAWATKNAAAAAVAVGAVAGLAYLLARSVVADVTTRLDARRAELAAERARVGDVITSFGEVLGASDPHSLLGVLVDTAVDATGAAGARLVLDGEEIDSTGDASTSETLEIPLDSDGSTVLFLARPPGRDFTDEERELAQWLGTQASIALENTRLHRQLEQQAATDGLTELANRRQFEEALAGEIERVERFGGTLSLILADLDDFKRVNDRYGHQAGDAVLRAVADVIHANVRAIDLPARYGGEEFTVLLPQTGLSAATQVAERLRGEVAARSIETPSGGPLAVTASFGVASFPRARTQAALFAAADAALYRAKAAGKNRVVVSDVGTAVHSAS